MDEAQRLENGRRVGRWYGVMILTDGGDAIRFKRMIGKRYRPAVAAAVCAGIDDIEARPELYDVIAAREGVS
jgi:hypothetical protein